MLFSSKRNFKDHMVHALVGFFVGAAVMSLLSSKSAEVSERESSRDMPQHDASRNKHRELAD